MSTDDLERVLRLPAIERVRFMGEIWDSLAAEDLTPDLSSAQRDELGRRLDRLEREGSQGEPWPEVRRRLESGERFA